MDTSSRAGYPRNFVFWTVVAVLLILGGLTSRVLDERITIEWPRLVWAAFALIQRILLEW